jgi:steroid delta-isomerase-like uncharacterized protein
MRREELRELVRRDEAAWNAHDADRLAALIAPDLAYRSVALSDPLHGREAFRELVAGYFQAFPDLQIDNRAVAFAEDTVVIEWRITGTHAGPMNGLPATGRPVDIRGCGVVHVDEAGLMASIDEYWNEMALLRQIGPVAIARSGARMALQRARALTPAGTATLRARTGR